MRSLAILEVCRPGRRRREVSTCTAANFTYIDVFKKSSWSRTRTRSSASALFLVRSKVLP